MPDENSFSRKWKWAIDSFLERLGKLSKHSDIFVFNEIHEKLYGKIDEAISKKYPRISFAGVAGGNGFAWRPSSRK